MTLTLTGEQLATVLTYREQKARMERLEAAEDRAFERYMNGTGTDATARKARSRVNAASTDLENASAALWNLMDEIGHEGYDQDAFAAEATR